MLTFLDTQQSFHWLSDKDIERFLHNQRLGKVIVKNNDFLDCGYLYYLMCSRTYRHEVLARFSPQARR